MGPNQSKGMQSRTKLGVSSGAAEPAENSKNNNEIFFNRIIKK
jgi:hypothetical protein